MLGTIVNLILQFLSGVIGGNLAGAAKSIQLSTLLKTTTGAVGGVLGDRHLACSFRCSPIPPRRPYVSDNRSGCYRWDGGCCSHSDLQYHQKAP